MEAEGVRLQLEAPLAWEARGTFAPQEIADWMRGNVTLLQALAALEAPPREPEGEHRAEAGLARLEAKIDLALALLGEIARLHAPLPPAVPVTLSADVLSWEGTAPPRDSLALVTLYLCPRLPWPLRLPVQVTEVTATRVNARLLHFSPEAQHWLDRTLFRHHRRALQARSR